MSSTRIRYNKKYINPNNDYVLLSKDRYTVNKHAFSIVIDSCTRSVKVLDNDVCLYTEGNKSLNELKKLAKKKLMELGIEFKSESRLNNNRVQELESNLEGDEENE